MARPRKYIRVGNREITGVSRHSDGRYYIIDASGKRVYFRDRSAAIVAYRALRGGPMSEEEVAQVQAATAASRIRASGTPSPGAAPAAESHRIVGGRCGGLGVSPSMRRPVFLPQRPRNGLDPGPSIWYPDGCQPRESGQVTCGFGVLRPVRQTRHPDGHLVQRNRERSATWLTSHVARRGNPLP